MAGGAAVLDKAGRPRQPDTQRAGDARRGVVDGDKAPKATRFVKTTATSRSLDPLTPDAATILTALKLPGHSTGY